MVLIVKAASLFFAILLAGLALFLYWKKDTGAQESHDEHVRIVLRGGAAAASLAHLEPKSVDRLASLEESIAQLKKLETASRTRPRDRTEIRSLLWQMEAVRDEIRPSQK